MKPGDKVIKEKTTVKPLYDPKPYTVVGIKAQVTCQRGGKEKEVRRK